MNTKPTIKNTYYDALFFASADFNKKQPFYLSPSEFKVIIKLIHYADTYQDITFQNKDIAKHTFLAERTVKNTCESLAKKGFTNSKKDIFNNRLGFASKRTITINWEFIQSIDDMINEVPSAIEAPIQPASAPEPVIELPVEEAPIQPELGDELEVLHTELTFRYNERGVGKPVTPADFNRLTDNFFKEVPFNEFWDIYKKYKISDVETFIQLFDELYNHQQKQAA